MVGVFTLEAEYGSRVVSGLVGEGMYQVDSLMMISAGAGAILVSTLGLLGVLCRNKCMLGLVSSSLLHHDLDKKHKNA